MEIKLNLSNTEHKELVSYCNLNDLLVSEVVKKSFTTGFSIERYGLLSDGAEVVEKVVEKGKIFTSAGGFQIEDPDLNPLISEIVGCADSVIGVPIDLTVALMEELRSNLHHLACVSEDREA